MYGNPCLRAARKSRSGERVRPGVGVFRVEFGKRQTTDALIGAIWSNAKRRQGFYVVEDMVGPWGLEPQTSTVSSGAHRFYNNIQDRGDCQSTRKFI
jgi:hypothetical protein